MRGVRALFGIGAVALLLAACAPSPTSEDDPSPKPIQAATTTTTRADDDDHHQADDDHHHHQADDDHHDDDDTTTTTTTIPTKHNGQIWVFGDSRCTGGTIYGNTRFTGWCSYLLDVPSNTFVKNFGFDGIGFTHIGSIASIRERFDSAMAPRGWPTKVYISAGVNDAGQGIDASKQIRDFRDYLAAHGVIQVWGTASYTDGSSTAWQARNVLVAAMNRTIRGFGTDPTSRTIRVGDCAGANPNPNTQDHIHPTNTDAARFKACMSATGKF